MRELDELLEDLAEDPRLREKPFSDDISACNAVLFDLVRSRQEKADALAKWLREWQPCLFGRIAATRGAMAYCIIDEADIARGDDHVRDLIQTHRRVWKRQALAGDKHGFIILAASERLARAEPADRLRDVALRLCELYLGWSRLNKILHDWLYLRIGPSEYRRWKVGVNYFSSQGDGRWWRDHRFPGGVAFSMNSVGHMARKLAEDELVKNPELAAKCKSVPRDKLVA